MIEFTIHELKLIERLKKRDRQWRWGRWLMLVTGTFCIIICVLCGYALHLVISISGGNVDSNVILWMMLYWTKCCLYFVLGLAFFIKVAMNWHGDANRKLLLKLIDAQSPTQGGA